MPISPLEISRAVIDVNDDPNAAALPMVDPAPTVRVSASGRFATIQALSILTAPVYFHYWQDGNYLGRNTTGRMTVRVEVGEQATFVVRATRSEDYAVDQNIPEAFSGIITVEWVRALPQAGSSVDYYELQTRIVGDAEGFVTVARVPALGQWRYEAKTPILDDGEDYNLRVRGVDDKGNTGTRILLGARLVVRTPDAVQITATLDSGNVTIAEDA